MTREDAIMILKNEQPHCGKRVLFPEEKKYEAYDVAIKALEQEPCEDATLKDIFCMGCEYKEQKPCEDAVSREAVLGLFAQNADATRPYSTAWKKIRDLPSVKPQPKTGHWIVHPKGIYAHLICDNCLSNAPYDCRTNYCPDCGAKMVETQESEV